MSVKFSAWLTVGTYLACSRPIHNCSIHYRAGMRLVMKNMCETRHHVTGSTLTIRHTFHNATFSTQTLSVLGGLIGLTPLRARTASSPSHLPAAGPARHKQCKTHPGRSGPGCLKSSPEENDGEKAEEGNAALKHIRDLAGDGK